MRLLSLIVILLLAASAGAQAGWRKETSGGAWTKRWFHNLAVFDSRLWVLNGDDGGTLHDLWSSTDGATWVEEFSSSPWGSFSGATVADFGGKMWLLGGNQSNVYLSEVWSTADGASWQQETPAAQWTGRAHHTTAVFNGKLWVIGGWSFQPPVFYAFNDVWSSTDGVNWTQEVAAANWSPRSTHATVVFDNKLWVIGGADGQLKSDVWSSPDGINWTEVTPAAPWQGRQVHTATVYGGRIWVMGGEINNYAFDDVWSSADGANWTRELEHAPWAGRTAHTSVIFNHRLWILGGGGNTGFTDDAWSYGVHVTNEKLPSGIIEVPYTAALQAREGSAPYSWSVIGGALPPGLTLGTSSSATCSVSGTPTSTGSFAFNVRLEDANGDWSEQQITLKIKEQSSRADRAEDTGCAVLPAGSTYSQVRMSNHAAAWLALVGLLATTAAALRWRSRVE